MPAGIRIEQQLVGIEAVSGARLVGAMDANAVDRAGVHVRQIAVPDLVGAFGQLDTRCLGKSRRSATWSRNNFELPAFARAATMWLARASRSTGAVSVILFAMILEAVINQLGNSP
jgi:hypothetical protein